MLDLKIHLKAREMRSISNNETVPIATQSFTVESKSKHFYKSKLHTHVYACANYQSWHCVGALFPQLQGTSKGKVHTCYIHT